MAAGTLIDYIRLTQKGGLPHLNPPRQIASHHLLEIDSATQRNLELMFTLTGNRKGSLLHIIDRTITNGGARLLSRRLALPLAKLDAIEQRHESVAFFLEHSSLRTTIRDVLKQCPDIERALSRLTLGRGGPRDLAAIREALKKAHLIRDHLTKSPLPTELGKFVDALGQYEIIIERLERALAEELPHLTKDGHFIAPGYLPKLDEYRELKNQGRAHIAALQTQYCEETGVNSLKVKHNNVLGYFIEVTAVNAKKLQEPFIHRQTMANAMRFITPELSELEQKINSAAEQVLTLELQIFADLVQEIVLRANDIAKTARALAGIDVSAAFGHLAEEKHYCRPKVDDSLTFRVEEGRHPVVEAMMDNQQGKNFVANDCCLNKNQKVWLITGPNMAGKSTFLRQNALILIMAQMGSFVPAKSAHIGLVDRLFSRVGASDNLAQGRSTFMVEMIETAAILNQSTTRSLVILDEVGRGTSTFDGVSIAWATVEHLHEHNQCRTLFATHYHELIQLEKNLSHLKCYTMQIQEWQGQVIFMHKIMPGAADRSYGIHVAEIAGLPQPVIKRAQEVLRTLENQPQRRPTAKPLHELPLFSNANTTPLPLPADPVGEKLKQKIASINPDELSPRDALEALYALNKLVKSEKT